MSFNNNNHSSTNATQPAPATASKGKGKGRKNKWTKVDLNDIAPLAAFSMPVQSKFTGTGKYRKEQAFSLRVEEDTQDAVSGAHRHQGPHRGVNIDGESLGEIADRLKKLDLEKARYVHVSYYPITCYPLYT